MRQFEMRRTYRDKDIIAFVLQTPNGVHVSLYGGDLPHIGVVGIIDLEGNRTVTQFPGHKEGVVCEKWIAALSAAGYHPAVVEVGIHYDGLDKDGIETVVAITNKLLDEVLTQLTKIGNICMKKFNKKAIIFDLDGVICFTDKFHYQAWKALADRLGIYFDGKINDRLRGVSRMASLEIILELATEEYTQQQKEAFTEEKNNTYRELLKNMSPADLTDEVRNTLIELRNRGYKLSIGSSSKNTKFILGQIGLGDFFDAIADGTDISRSKPDPEVFIKSASKLGIDPADCAVVEDAKAGIEAAKAGGMTALALFGDAKGCGLEDYDLKSFSDLLNIL